MEESPLMNSALSIAQSGMQVSRLQMDTAAHNVANNLTPGFRRQTINQSEQAGGGVTATLDRMPEKGADLAGDMVGQKMASYVFVANLRTIQTEQKMVGSLLDATA